jgi:hypothetical protein
VIALAAAVLAVKCFCCAAAAKSPKKLTKDDIAGPNRTNQTNQSHNGFNYGLDNKGVDTAKDSADSPDIIKSQMYGYNSYPAMPAAQVPTNLYATESTSNSNNGGSVNSQVFGRETNISPPPPLEALKSGIFGRIVCLGIL